MLTREMSHRVKNSLASVVGLLRVQGRNAQLEEVQDALDDAASRITTIAQLHDHLWRSTRIGFVDIADFAGELCGKLQENRSRTHNKLQLRSFDGFSRQGDSAWPPDKRACDKCSQACVFR